MLPPHLMSSRDRLEPESYVTIQNHPRLGVSLLEPFFFLREASVLVAHHHERWDGSGYPYGIRGRFIPLGARILSIADAFDAIEIPDVLCPDIRRDIALRIIRVASGTQFDPHLVHILTRDDDRFSHSQKSARRGGHPRRDGRSSIGGARMTPSDNFWMAPGPINTAASDPRQA